MAEEQQKQQPQADTKKSKKKDNKPKRNYDKKLITLGDYFRDDPEFQQFYNQLKKHHGSKSRRN